MAPTVNIPITAVCIIQYYPPISLVPTEPWTDKSYHGNISLIKLIYKLQFTYPYYFCFLITHRQVNTYKTLSVITQKVRHRGTLSCNCFYCISSTMLHAFYYAISMHASLALWAYFTSIGLPFVLSSLLNRSKPQSTAWVAITYRTQSWTWAHHNRSFRVRVDFSSCNRLAGWLAG